MINYFDNILQNNGKFEVLKLSTSALKINAVYEEDIVKLLDSLEVRSIVENGLSSCSECGNFLSIKDIALIYPEENEIKFCCYQVTCYANIMRRKHNT